METEISGRRGVSIIVFGSVTVVLLIIAASGFLLYVSRPPETMTETVTTTFTSMATETMTESISVSSSSSNMMNETTSEAIAFAPVSGQMFSAGWLVIAPLGNGSYVVSIYARGLEAPSIGDYLVEATQNSGGMAMVPIAGTNATLSEFSTDGHGTGQYFLILRENPRSVFESISLVFLPGMAMENATVVAMAPLAMSHS